MLMSTGYSIFLNESLRKQQQILPICRSIKEECRVSEISAARFLFVGTDIDFVLNFLTLCLYSALIYGSLKIKELVYNQSGIYIRSFFPPCLGRPQ